MAHARAVPAWVPRCPRAELITFSHRSDATQARSELKDAGAEGEVRVVEGDAAMALLEASQLARMLVLGEPHHGLGRIGSVARRCQADAACPVCDVAEEV